jgi:hypothetical protein
MDKLSHQPQRMTFFYSTWAHLKEFFWIMRNLFWPLGGKILSAIFSLLLGGLAIWGYFTRVRSGVGVLEVFAVCYAGAAILWPWAGDPRFLLPLMPLFLMYIACAMRSLPATGKLGYRRIAVIVLAAGFAGSCLTGYAAMNYGPIRESFGNPDFMAACSFIKDKAPPDAVVICIKPRLSSLITGHRSTSYELNASDESLLQWFKDCGARYFLTSPELPGDQDTLLPLIQRHPKLFRLLFRSGNFNVFERNAAESIE